MDQKQIDLMRASQKKIEQREFDPLDPQLSILKDILVELNEIKRVLLGNPVNES